MTKAKTKERESAPDLLHVAGVEGVIEAPVVGAGVGNDKRHRPRPKGQEVAPVQQHQPPAEVAPNMLLVIARAAGDPNVNPEKMRALLDMQKEIRAEEARIAFSRDFIRMKPHIPKIDAKGKIVIEGKSGKPGQKTPFAKYNDIHKGVTKILHDHGFAISYSTEPAPPPSERLMIRATLEHVEGYSRSSTFPVGADATGGKNTIQAWGSGFSYGKRYGIVALLDLISDAPEDADDDGKAAGAIVDKSERPKEIVFASKLQIDEMMKAIEDCGVGLEVVCNKYEIDALRDLPSEMVPAVLKACATFKANQEAKRAHG